MATKINSLAGFAAHGFDAVIDVRSPAEYAEDHIPGAINLPVLSNDERAKVGTIYVQENAFKARKIGAALVARNAARHLEETLHLMDGGWRPLVYCWRGGQRSGSFASILTQVGWRAETVEGGYQSYRRLVADAMHMKRSRHRFVLLDGNTGTAKTEVLGHLKGLGHQTIDLEGLARHRGSVFGALEGGQPSQKAFEGALALELAEFDPALPVVAEAESSKIGQLQVPPSIWAAMCAAPRVRIVAPLQARARYLTTAYADIVREPEKLKQVIALLHPMQGHASVERWQAMVDASELTALAAELMEHHYDPRYVKSRGRINAAVMGEVFADDLGHDGALALANDISGLLKS